MKKDYAAPMLEVEELVLDTIFTESGFDYPSAIKNGAPNNKNCIQGPIGNEFITYGGVQYWCSND